MKNSLRLKVITIIAATSLWLGMGTANAGTFFGPWDLNPTEALANFGNNDISGSFEDHIAFTLPLGYTGDGGASVIAGYASGFNVFISQFSFWDVTDNVLLASDGGIPFIAQWFDFTGPLAQSHSYELVIKGNLLGGHLDGSYAGNFAIAAIPEPETYAMLLAGLGLLGFMSRRRKENV